MALTTSSPAINSGNPDSVTTADGAYSATLLPKTDLIGNPRISGGRVDIGASEFQDSPCNLVLDAYPSLTVPSGSSLTLTASGTTNYKWDTGATTANVVITPTSNSVFSVTGTTGNCLTAASLSINVCPIVYVTPTGAGLQNGSSWSHAYPGSSLQTAINTASLCGTQVWVAAGLYKPTSGPASRNVGFMMKNRVSIFGGFAGNETTLAQRPLINAVTGLPSSSTLSGDIGVVGDAGDNSYHVIINNSSRLNNSAVLDGFVVTGGNANGSSFSDQPGGGVYNQNSNPTITNCSFINNKASDLGGGMYNDHCNSIQLVNCSWQDNTGSRGGGLANFISLPQITNCTFQNNSASSLGGAMFNGTGGPYLTNCSFLNNSAAQDGGGICNSSSNISVLNCSFQGNVATQKGGAITNYNSYSLTFTNCLLWNNGGSNSIANLYGSTLLSRYSLFDASTTGYGNDPTNLTTTVSPFENSTSVTLSTASLAINSGDPDSFTQTTGPYINKALPSTDLLGNLRIVGGRVDIGAVEYNEIFTLKNGTWTDASIWNVNRLPTSGERIHILHKVNVPASYQAVGGRLLYGPNGQMIFGTGSLLKFTF
jgi:hypothetical protein